jgi:hypothetical protein
MIRVNEELLKKPTSKCLFGWRQIILSDVSKIVGETVFVDLNIPPWYSREEAAIENGYS